MKNDFEKPSDPVFVRSRLFRYWMMLSLSVTWIFSPNKVNLYSIWKLMINWTTFLQKGMPWKFMVRDLLLIVSWIGCVDHTLAFRAKALIFFKKSIEIWNLVKKITLGNRNCYILVFISSDLCYSCLLYFEQNSILEN